MVPVGEAMAEALLESDESTASLSEASIDKDSFDEVQTAPSFRTRCTVPFKPRNRRGGNRNKCVDTSATVKRPQVQPLSLGGPERPVMISRHVALDCEMVGVGPQGKRSVLARVSLVDYFGNILLNTFVRVIERVTDFRAHVTGISEHHLSSKDAMPFGKCRQLVIKLIRNKLLVGHALQNDLTVLGIHHPWYDIRDTSTFYLYQKKNRFGVTIGPSRLRDLAKLHLGIDIQKSGQAHCPCEDACAAMALYQKNQSHFDYLVECQRQRMMFRNPMGPSMRH